MTGFSYSSINGPVTAVAADGQGGWYIAGNFTAIGNYERHGLAHLNSGGEVLPFNARVEGERCMP
ncbi:MAG: hypothetical protein NZM25_06140 [Leptospiraceae bacterium]|nr:hypothetical protein [Leptospiraceae bacterium]MDW8306645.1 hypothetical protein [Leptospiraceae bacterium]